MLCSSWRVQWWSEFNGVGKRNSDEGLKMLYCQPGLPAGFADGIIAPEGAMGKNRDCMLSLLPVIQPSDSQTALFPPPHLSSGSNSLSSTERGWGKTKGSTWLSAGDCWQGWGSERESLMSAWCHQQSWSDLRCIIYGHWRRGSVHFGDDSSCLVTSSTGLSITFLSLSWLPARKLFQERHLIWMDVIRKHKGEFGWRGAQFSLSLWHA